MNATHTHTAPVVRIGLYPIPTTGVTQVKEYHAFFSKKTARAIKEAWDNRKLGSVTWGVGNAKIGHNRRATYRDVYKRQGRYGSPVLGNELQQRPKFPLPRAQRKGRETLGQDRGQHRTISPIGRRVVHPQYFSICQRRKQAQHHELRPGEHGVGLVLPPAELEDVRCGPFGV